MSRGGRVLRLAAGLLAAGLAAAEPALACPALPAGEAIARLVEHGVADLDLAPDLLLAGAGEQSVCFALASPAADAAHQALAHALGAWLVPAGDGTWLASRAHRLPQATLQAITLPSTLLERSELEAPVLALLDPWLEGHAGIGYHPVDGSWSGTLDEAGGARLRELVQAIERPRATAPPLIPEPPAAALPQAGPLPAAPWRRAVPAIAAAWGVAVAVAPGTPEPAPALPAGGPAALAGALEAAGLRAAWVRDVLCVGRDAPVDRLHPALRRRLAVLPVPHLATDAAGAAALATHLRASVAPAAWGHDGWGILAVDRTLLVAADAPAIHRVMDALAAIDDADPAAPRLPAAPVPAILPP